MKKWLKRYGKWVIISLGFIFIVNSSYWVFIETGEGGWRIYHASLAAIWVIIILFILNILQKLFEWWEKE